MRAIYSGMEGVGTRAAFSSQIVNYAVDDLVSLLSPKRRAGDGRNLRIFQEAEIDGQRGENARLSGSTRFVRLSGLHLWSLLLDKDGQLVWRPKTSIEEEDSGGLPPDQRSDRPKVVRAGHGGTSRPTQPHHGWIDELLFAKDPWVNLSDRNPTCLQRLVDGCVGSTRCRRDRRSRAIRSNICIVSWDLSCSACATATFRGRQHGLVQPDAENLHVSLMS